MQTKGNRKSGVTKKRGIRKTKKGGNKAGRQKNRGLGKSKKMKGRTRRQPRIYGGVWNPFRRAATVAPAPNKLDKKEFEATSLTVKPAPMLTGRELENTSLTVTPAPPTLTPEEELVIKFSNALQNRKFDTALKLLDEEPTIENHKYLFAEYWYTIRWNGDSWNARIIHYLIELYSGYKPEQKEEKEQTEKTALLRLINRVIDIISNQPYKDEIINAKSANGSTALADAIQFDLNEIVEILIPISTKEGLNHALILTALSGKTDYVNRLIDAGADVNATHERGISVLMTAMRSKNVDTINLLLEKGADVNATAKNGDTALMDAVLYANVDIIKLLLEKGADVNAKNSDGYSVIITAVQIKDGEVLKLLIEKGADVNAKDNDRGTPLMVATNSGVLNNVIALIEAGADVTVKNKNDKTALDMAIMLDERENPEKTNIIELLQAEM